MTRRSPQLKFIFLFLAILGCSQKRNPPTYNLQNIFGADDRQELLGKDSPWSSIGRLDSGCNGTVIGSKFILTAAHCIIDGRTGKVKDNVNYFYLENPVGHKIRMNYFWLGSTTPEKDRRNDWAIVKLKEPVSDSLDVWEIYPVDVSNSLPLQVNLAGFSIDRNNGNTLTNHENCSLLKVRDNGRILHDCDASSGISGAPLYLFDVQVEPKIVGISVSEYRQGAANSVVRDDYSDEYANVGISILAVSDILEKVEALVDNEFGEATSLEGVIGLPNPNTRTVPIDLPLCDNTVCLVETDVFFAHTEEIYKYATILVSVADDLSILGEKANYRLLSVYSNQLRSSATRFAYLAVRVARGVQLNSTMGNEVFEMRKALLWSGEKAVQYVDAHYEELREFDELLDQHLSDYVRALVKLDAYLFNKVIE